MAIENKYTDPLKAVGGRSLPQASLAAQASFGNAPLAVAVADNVNSVYRVLADMPTDLRVVELHARVKAAITAGVFNVGIARPTVGNTPGATLDATLFATGVSLAAVGVVDLTTGVPADRCNMTIAELFAAKNGGQQLTADSVDIILTTTTQATAAGSAVVQARALHW